MSNTQLPDELDADILWDENSALIGDDIDDLNYWSGRDVMKKEDFIKAITPFVTKLHQVQQENEGYVEEIESAGSLIKDYEVLKAKCERYEAAIKILEDSNTKAYGALIGGMPKDVTYALNTLNQGICAYRKALSAGEGKKEVDNG